MNVRVYIGQVFVLLMGSGAAQLINFASYPVLTRLYTPAEFGGFALFLTAAGILGPIACARLDLIVQSSTDWELAPVFRLALRMNLMLSGATAVLGIAYAAATGNVDATVALLVSLAVFLTGFTLCCTAFLIRHERYRLSAQAMMVRSLVAGLAQIGLWFLLPGSMALIVGFCLGFLAQGVMLALPLRQFAWRRSTPLHLRAVCARHRRQVTTDIPSTLLAGVILHVMSLQLLDLYSTDEVGHYSLAFRVAVLPLALISGSLQEVFFQKASASYRATGGFWAELRFNLVSAAGLSILIFVPMALLARPAFVIAFGREWLPAAEMLIYLLPMLAMRFVAAAVQPAPLVVGRASWLLMQNLALVAVILAAYGIAKTLGLGLESFLLLTSLLMAGVYGGYILLLTVTVNRRYRAATGAPSKPAW